MGRRKIGERNIRKLNRVGSSKSIGLTLPIEEVRNLCWKEKQKVIVKRVGKKLVIEDWKK